jgi:signal transduction histidine kinase
LAAARVRSLLLVAALALALAMLVGSTQRGPLTLGAILQMLVGVSFAACGSYLWARRPANRVGPLMTTVGMLWLVGRTLILVPLPLTFTVGSWLSDLWAVAFAVFLLSIPTGRLTSRTDAAIVGIFLFVSVPLELVWMLFWVPGNGLNALALAPDVAIAHVVDTIQRILISFGAVLLVASLGWRWLRSSGPVRRQMSPALVGGVAILLQSASWTFLSSGQTIDLLDDLIFVAQIAIPVAILTVLLRARLARSGIADLVVELGQTPTPGRLREALASALGDPTLQLAYWAPRRDQFIDATGTPMDLPGEGQGQAVTLLERNGVPEAAIIHDAILLDEPGLVASVVGALRLAVDNDRLTGEVVAQLDEVRASRARIVAAGDAERQRVERDLHDGAQQRIVAMTLALRLARTRLGDDADPEVMRSLEQASEEGRAALSELRELARGIHPQILTEAGLHAAIESLAARTSASAIVSVDFDRNARFEPVVEAVMYFVVSESLANVAKHAPASSVHICGAWENGIMTIEIGDDGPGGADLALGTGIRGLRDRVAAVGGTLEVVSPPGGGTRVVARIPAAAPSNAADRRAAGPAT